MAVASNENKMLEDTMSVRTVVTVQVFFLKYHEKNIFSFQTNPPEQYSAHRGWNLRISIFAVQLSIVNTIT
jgi:hypothetical protein